ncbi:MAG: hypothetical protein JO309_03820 [Pseudonocardiales bacterium]|nr:hypothetical protein [Pseudonocardiales bacterium]MBV9728537.1 hypothetical protein [Pseudonocardiales bacterium]
MSDALSFAEIDGQHVELLPARTVLSMFSAGGSRGGGAGTGGAGAGGQGVTGGEGGPGMGKAELFNDWFYTEGDVYNNLTSGNGGTGGAASAGAPTGGAGGAGH